MWIKIVREVVVGVLAKENTIFTFLYGVRKCKTDNESSEKNYNLYVLTRHERENLHYYFGGYYPIHHLFAQSQMSKCITHYIISIMQNAQKGYTGQGSKSELIACPLQ